MRSPDIKSLKFKMWSYFIFFAVILMAVLWSMQIFMFQNFYDKMKTEEVMEIADAIAGEYGQLNLDEMASYAYTSDIYIQIETSDGLVVYTPQDGDFQRPATIALYNSVGDARRRLAESTENTVSFTVNPADPDMPRTLAYGKRIGDGGACLYIVAPLTPVESTIEILAKQLIQVTIFSLILAFVLAIFLSGRIAKPLVKITKSAGELARGNYGVHFEGGSYTEVNQLADTLTHTSRELAKADNLQKDLLANVSHDLRTPLTMVKSYAEMIRDLSGDIPEKREAHLQVIIDEADRLNMLVGDLLTLSKMQSGAGSLEMGTFDLKEAAAGILQTYDILAEKEGYRIELICSHENASVYGDVQRIKQVLANLVSNAIRYGGEARHVVVRIVKDPAGTLCEVQDFGPGIPEGDLEHIWERYHKGSANGVRAAAGSTGLGLAIVKEILTLHHAEYGVRSTVGEGSTFWFRLVEQTKKYH